MSFIKVRSGGIWGIEGYEVSVEVDVSPGLPSFNIVGLPDTAIKESKERVRSAVKNAGFSFPNKRITVNLSPSALKKQGTFYDLPIAVGILALCGYVPPDKVERFLFLGELSLDGKVSKVRGTLPIVMSLSELGCKEFILPKANALEGSVVEGVRIYMASDLVGVVRFLRGEGELGVATADGIRDERSAKGEDIDLGDVLGQELAKKALEIAAAGFHNLSMVGSPGSGKSMMARGIRSILPPMSPEEALEVSRIYSVAGLLEEGLIKRRPFRSPHHTASEVSIVGGGTVPVPGEISLAHKGVLFLDELPEFSRKTLEVLRQPLENGYINVARAQGKVRFPAEFMLITAQNPCPCGNYGNPFKECRCTKSQIRAYTSKVSQPIKDRIDLHVWVSPPDRDELLGKKRGEPSRDIYNRVLRAYEIQRERGGKFNGRMNNREVERFVLRLMDGDAKKLLSDAVERFKLSGRGYFKVLKVSRTVADLEGSETVKAHHVAQALQFREESLV